VCVCVCVGVGAYVGRLISCSHARAGLTETRFHRYRENEDRLFDVSVVE
jgi:hypothetical protein